MISIIICTYNRCENLKGILNSLLDQEYRGDFGYEVIVVDNNSKDKTKEVVESFGDSFNGKLKYIFESNQGLSYARNRGIEESKGDIVAFIDDDAIAEKDWLKNLYSTFVKYNADCVGGKITPLFLGNKPKWLTREIWGNIGLLDYGEEEFVVSSEKYPIFGCNMAFTKKELLENGLFNEKLGRIGKKLFSHEETDIFNKMLSKNKKIVYEPKAIVKHKVNTERLRKNYFRRWNFYDGIVGSRTIENKRKYIFGIPFYIILKFFSSIWIYLRQDKEEKRFIEQLKIFYYFGVIAQRFKKNIL